MVCCFISGRQFPWHANMLVTRLFISYQHLPPWLTSQNDNSFKIRIRQCRDSFAMHCFWRLPSWNYFIDLSWPSNKTCITRLSFLKNFEIPFNLFLALCCRSTRLADKIKHGKLSYSKPTNFSQTPLRFSTRLNICEILARCGHGTAKC